MKKFYAIAALACIVLVFLLEPIALAWMSDNGLSSPIDITSNVHKSYFESGDGTKELKYDENGNITAGPYEIKHPIQLYYFAWLQYLGFFNVDNNNDGKIDTVYFRISADIDMDNTNNDDTTSIPADQRYKYVLPPIGTTNMPFLGNFDGEGHTVTDLTVENVYDNYLEPPKEAEQDFGGVEIVGFFGVVGELTEGSYSYDKQANEIKNLALKNLTVKTQTNQTLIGLVAGYVNGIINCVGVADSKVNIKQGVTALSYTANVSDYSLIGYCTDAFKDSVYVMDVVLSKPTTSDKYTVVPEVGGDGDTHGWGGSVKMKDIFQLMQNVNTTSNNRYTLERTDVVTLDGKTVTISTGGTNTKNNATISNFGAFVFTDMEWDGNIINFASGSQKVTKFEYAYTENDVNVYHITDGTNYLCFNGTDITNTTNSADATKWYASNGTNGGNVYTVVNGSVYYLTVNNNTISTIKDNEADFNNLPSWSISNGAIAYNGVNITFNQNSWQITSPTGIGDYYISYTYGNTVYYLNNNSTTSVRRETNINNATGWNITAVNGGRTISTVINGTTYYLGNNGTNNQLVLSTNQTVWQYDQNNNRFSISVREWMWNTTYYLRYDNNNSNFVFQTADSQNRLTLTQSQQSEPIEITKATITASGTTAKEIVLSEVEYIDNSTENYTYNENGEKVVTGAGITYIPLAFDSTNNQYSVSDNNTGYIIASQWGAIEKDEYDANGNIRISRYGESNMSNYTTPYTMTYKTYKNSTSFQTINAQPSASHLSLLGLQKYADCYADFRKSITADNNCYGLHFMQASVSLSNLVTINAHLNGKDIPNYQMPTNCIDFNLYDRGFINFVGGSYYTAEDPDNNSFFSIYEIIRDPNDETIIVEIKEINKVYAKLNANDDIDTSKAYVYTYTVNGVETGKDKVPADYEMVFDCRWITHSSEYGGWTNNRAYYFEVPVNAGEYAIGSTAGRMGAYLVYLDLAANAQLIERVKDQEKITEKKTAATIPNGVELLAPGETCDKVDPSDSAFVSINGATGDIIFKNENGITVTHSTTGGIKAEYIGMSTVLKENGNTMTLQGVITTIDRTTYRDHNLNTGVYTVTVITKTTVIDGTNETVTYTKQVTATDADGNVIADQTYDAKEVTAAEAFPDTKDTDTSPTVTAGKDLINLYFAYGQEVDLTVDYLYTPAVKDENGNVTTAATYLITVTNPGSEDVTIKALLTAEATTSGITFIITDGTTSTTLNNNTNAQTVTIAASNSGTGDDASGETGGEVEEPTT